MADKSTQFSLTKNGTAVGITHTDTAVIAAIETDHKAQIVDIVCNYDIKTEDPHSFYGVQTDEDWITITDKGEGKFRLLLKENFTPMIYVQEEDGSETKYNQTRIGRIYFYSYVNTDDVLELDIIQDSTEYKVELNGSPEITKDGELTIATYNFNVVGGCEEIYVKSIVKVLPMSETEETEEDALTEKLLCYDDDLHINVESKKLTITDFGMIEDDVQDDIVFRITVAHKNNRLSTCEVEYTQTYTGENKPNIIITPATAPSIPAKGGQICLKIATGGQTEWDWFFSETGGKSMHWLDIEEGAEALLISAQSFNDTEEDERKIELVIFKMDEPDKTTTIEIKQEGYNIQQAAPRTKSMVAAYRKLSGMTIQMPPVYTRMNSTLIFDWDGTPVDNDGYIDVETTPSDSMIMAKSLSYFVKCNTDRHRVSFTVERSKSPEGHHGLVRIKNAEDNSSALDISIIQLPYTQES